MLQTQSSVGIQDSCAKPNEKVTLHKVIPSNIGRIITTVYGELTIFQLNVPVHIIDRYLPNILSAFPAPITMTDRMKRNFVYTESMTAISRSQLNDDIQNLSSFTSDEDFFQQLLPRPEDMIRYNMIILGDCILFARIPQTYKIPYYLLCKHITLANRSTDVRFAGEFWRGDDEHFRLNNNSGTYRPPQQLIEPTIALFKYLFPFLEIQGFSREESARPPTFDRFKFKLKQKLLCA